MKFFSIFFIYIISFSAYTQERNLLYGQVLKNDSVVEKVHVQNVSNSRYSVTNEEGIFTITARSGDTLVLSHVSVADDLIRFLKPDDIESDTLIIMFKDHANELEEIVLDEDSDINAVSLGIIPKRVKKLTVNERRLRTAGDFKPIQLLGIFGGSLPIDPILNALSGRTKKLKRNVAIEKTLWNLNFLQNNYSGYMKKNMEIPEEEISLFINFVVEEEGIQQVIDSRNGNLIHFFLHDSWYRFREAAKQKTD